MKKTFLISLAAALLPLVAGGAVSFNGGTVVENFTANNFAAQGTNTSVTWVNDLTVPNWYADSRATTIIYGWGAGVSSTTAVYGYKFDAGGNTTAPAGSLGTRSTSADAWGIAWAIQNNTSETFTEFSLQYDGFVSKYNADAGPDGYTVSYQIGGSYADGLFANIIPSAAYVAPTNQPDGAGNPVVSSTVTSDSVTGISWAPGEILWIKWFDTIAAGGESTYGLGIDNVSFTAVPEPATYALLSGLAVLGLIALRRRRRD